MATVVVGVVKERGRGPVTAVGCGCVSGMVKVRGCRPGAAIGGGRA